MAVLGVDFDIAALEAFLTARFGTGQTTIERIRGGQSNPTYFVTHGPRAMVLRKQPMGKILPGAHRIDREFRVLSALAETDVPVPLPLVLIDDPDVLGTPFYLMDRLDGRVFGTCALPECQPDDRRAIYLAMADTLAQLHRVVPEHVGLGDFGKPGDYFERQMRRWGGQMDSAQIPPDPALSELVAWLRANTPADDGAKAIAHGDFRLGNLMFHPSKPQIVGVLDWELSTIGHPLADLGFCCMTWNSPPEEYGGILGLDRRALGIPEKAAFVDRYQQTLDAPAPLTRFHEAFAMFRFSVIFLGIAERVRRGTAADPEAAKLAPLSAAFARRALDVIFGRA